MITQFQKSLLMLLFFAAFHVSANVEGEQSLRGEYIYNMGGCASCHTAKDGKPLAGGLEMDTKFGTFVTPNISPDKSTGIGTWSDEDFIRAMREGEAPDGRHYYPAFPYTSYKNMKRQDLLDLKHFLEKQVAVKHENKPHELNFPFNQRPLLGFWKWLNFEKKPYQPNPDKSLDWNRGAYIVNGPGHCAECHSPRNLLGGLSKDEWLAGNSEGPEGEAVPGLSMDKKNRISEWSEEDIIFSLQMGMIPDGDFLGGSMGHVIDNTTSKLSDADLKAITTYLRNIEDNSDIAESK